MSFKSMIFPTKEITLANTTETIVPGGRDKLHLLVDALPGIKQIGVIGYKSQGRAQALNWRDSLVGLGIKVKVGLREKSESRLQANEDGFSVEDGTLGEVFEVIRESDLVLMLIEDAAQVELHEKIFANMKPGAILGFSHGFLLGHLQSIGKEFPEHFSVIGVCPKGMGASVRRLYEQGKDINGAGINCSFAVEQDIDKRAIDVALGWATAIGAPYTFKTTLEKEYRSDIFGERGVLLGAVHGIVEALYRYFVMECGNSEERAFTLAVETITGPLSQMISKQGIKAVYDHYDAEGKREFSEAYSAAYPVFMPILHEIYDEVASGNEIRSVVMTGKRLKRFPMSTIDNTSMWKTGEIVRAKRVAEGGIKQIHPLVAGIYCAIMMAQIDVLQEHGHCWSEMANESIIEAVDSLNPYMHFKGIAHMVDNCSRTARIGTRKWGPKFDHAVMQQVIPALEDQKVDEELMNLFENHPIHGALAECAKMRPPVDIAVFS